MLDFEKDANWLLKEKYHGQETPEYLKDVERLKAGEPLAYVIGHVPFLNDTIYLDSKPLIPRPETEFWVDCCIDEQKRQEVSLVHPPQRERSERGLDVIKTSLKILDLCAGSGCIGVAVGKAIPKAHITFGEIDPLHIPTILKNCLANGMAEERFTIITSDLFENISGQFNFILSNPPYIDPALDRAEPAVKAHEPHQALYGGRGGVELIEKIIAAAPAHLTKGGQLWLEHEPEQAEFIAACASTYGFEVTAHKDQYGVLRFSSLTVL